MLNLIEAREAIIPIFDLAVKRDYRRRLCQIYTIIGSYYYFVEDDYPKAFKSLEEALRISEEVGNIISLLLANFWYACALGFNCEFERSVKHFQRNIELNEVANNPWGIGMAKSTLAYHAYLLNGKIDLAFKTSNEAVQIAEESGDIYSKTVAYLMHGVSCYAKGLKEETNRYFLNGLEFCEGMNLPGWNAIGLLSLGESYFEMGDFQRSKEYFEKGTLALMRGRILPSWAGFGKVCVARAKLMNKEMEVNLESLYDQSKNNRIKAAEGWIHRHIGEILLNIDDQHISEAEHWIQSAIEADQRNRMMFHLGNDYPLYADLFRRKGDRSKAQENLGKAIEILKECGADGWVKKYEEEMTKLA